VIANVVKIAEKKPETTTGTMRAAMGIVLVLCLVLSHCATFLSLSDTLETGDPPEIYGGTQIDIILIYGGINLLPVPTCAGLGALMLVGGIIDLPFSFVADTLLLPVTVPWNLAAHERDLSEEPDEPELLEESAPVEGQGPVKQNEAVEPEQPAERDAPGDSPKEEVPVEPGA
jgi:uncharacterized protein YceK